MAIILNQVIGHQSLLTKLFQAYNRQHLSHCLLFEGPIGVGKSLIAKGFAQFLTCENRAEFSACGECGSCFRALHLPNENTLYIEPEKHMIKLEQVKVVDDFFQLQSSARSRVVIIDDANRLNPFAGNHLLKILEEPPDNCFFILISPSGDSLLPTLKSRSVRIRFKPIPNKEMATKFSVSPEILKLARGSVAKLQNMLSEENVQLLERTKQIISLWKQDPQGYLNQTIKESFKDRKQAADLFASITQIFLQKYESPSQDMSDLQSLLPELAWQSHKCKLELEQNLDSQLLIEKFWIKSWQQRQGYGVD